MRSISSAEFRKTYPRLTETVAITVNGHVIGVWTPGASTQDTNTDLILIARDEVRAKTIAAVPQAQRDAILNRVNRKTERGEAK